MSDNNTIFALSSGAGRSGLAVIRLTGPHATSALEALTRTALPEPRRMALRNVWNPEDGELIDRGLVVRFTAPGSVTGEDVAELHVHGGRAIVAALLEGLERLGLRLAEPGEFTRRAFENGKLDLTAAEGLADLIEAETEVQRRQAIRQMGGSLSALYETWRAELVRAAALFEAVIDFPDEEIPTDTQKLAVSTLTELSRSIGQHLDDNHMGERLRDGFRVAVIGAPNVGKSSLVNALARRDVAIVSDQSGTTRDVIEVHLDLAGIPVIVSDTAGLRQTEEAVEAEGIRRARRAAAEADLTIFMFDVSADKKRDAMEQETKSGDLIVANKTDLVDPPPLEFDGKFSVPVVYLSVKTGRGMGELLDRIAKLAPLSVGTGYEGNLTRRRHRSALIECREAIDRCLDREPSDIALWAEDVRLSARALGRITGKTDVETVLDALFAEFCIGK